MEQIKTWLYGVLRPLQTDPKTECSEHLCKRCGKSCAQCVAIIGSSVDGYEEQLQYGVQGLSKVLTNSASQTDPLPSQILQSEMQGDDLRLPDLLASMAGLQLLAPPPPPPPPPPPAPKVKPIARPRKLSKNRTERKSTGAPLQPEITAEALMSIKLRPTESNIDITQKEAKRNRPLHGQPAVTMEVLQSISLRKTSRISTRPQSEAQENKENIDENRTGFRQLLKKTTLDRSPGGTPLNCRNNQSWL